MTEPIVSTYRNIRENTIELTKHLKPEDSVVQPIEDVSPAKWHLAHTSWFFENFILQPHLPGYRLFHKDYGFLFNSYYNSQGKRVSRNLRGFQTRPGWEEVKLYRKHVDEEMERFFVEVDPNDSLRLTIQVGLNHEQQHQELLITDTKYILSLNVIDSPMLKDPLLKTDNSPEGWITIPEGIKEIGYAGPGFCFDNEQPKHRVFQPEVEISRKAVTVSDYLEFIADGGYANPLLWLSDGWAWKEKNQIKSPLYWKFGKNETMCFTTAGWKILDPEWPVCHVSYYEADAFASWAGMRLCTETERELIDSKLTNNQCWEWTSSAYGPYPGFQSWKDALGEYNGKFMVNQMVLRGGSVATPKGHYRSTYRNFFHPDKQWQFSGIRLAKTKF